MKEVFGRIIKMFCGIGGLIAGLFGGWDGTLTVLVVVMVIDYISGMIVGIMNRSLKSSRGGLDSKIGAKGILKKGLMLLVVLLGAMLDQGLGGEQAMFRSMVVWFYIANESLSVLENVAMTDLPIPQKMKEVLEQWKEKEEKI